ncbi:nanos homolog 2 [Ambystoma mexicanum]|uniref:nanos homolog 2 n=1 Tax=Ambystoma mexicanum TaxID=8296 RepID=UPI0037E6F872
MVCPFKSQATPSACFLLVSANSIKVSFPQTLSLSCQELGSPQHTMMPISQGSMVTGTMPPKSLFDPWRDYFNLSSVVAALVEERQREWEHRLTRSLDSSPGPTSPNSLEMLPSSPCSICNFCKHNGESKKVYSSHILKKGDGTIVCPVLRKYACPLCGATGDRAHTLKYCPLNQEKQSLYRKSGRNSAGRRAKR